MQRDLACDFWSNSIFPFSGSANPAVFMTPVFTTDSTILTRYTKGLKYKDKSRVSGAVSHAYNPPLYRP